MLPCWVLVGAPGHRDMLAASTPRPDWFRPLWLLRPYLVPFFFEKVFLTLRWRLLSSKAANPPLSRVTVSSMLEMPFPTAGMGERVQTLRCGAHRGPAEPHGRSATGVYRVPTGAEPGLGWTRVSVHGGRGLVGRQAAYSLQRGECRGVCPAPEHQHSYRYLMEEPLERSSFFEKVEKLNILYISK